MRRLNAPHPLLRRVCALAGLLLGVGTPASHAGWDEFADAMENTLGRVSGDGNRSVQLSGRLDLAVHHLPEPVADLRYTAPDTELLFSPVLRLFADAHLGAAVDAHAQLRADRGFDPADESLEARMEEATLRLTPRTGSGRRASLRAGRFATVFGSWARRQSAWDYPFITAPLAQENLTGLWHASAPPDAVALERWAHVNPVGDASALAGDERRRIPIMWGPVYATGAALAVGGSRWDLDFEIKNAGLSSRPATWDDLDSDAWSTPAGAARIGWRPATAWNLGLSFSRGLYLEPGAGDIAAGHSRSDYTQTSIGHDLTYARGHFQFWGELIASRFEVPSLGHADTLACALEAKYRFTPRWAAFARWSRQFFAPIQLANGNEADWGRDAWRIEAGVAARLAAHAQIKIQTGLLHERPSTEKLVPSAAAQLSLRF